MAELSHISRGGYSLTIVDEEVIVDGLDKNLCARISERYLSLAASLGGQPLLNQFESLVDDSLEIPESIKDEILNLLEFPE